MDQGSTKAGHLDWTSILSPVPLNQWSLAHMTINTPEPSAHWKIPWPQGLGKSPGIGAPRFSTAQTSILPGLPYLGHLHTLTGKWGDAPGQAKQLFTPVIGLSTP